jgi:anti-sigma regulatory factor (Ser/Thr protein kinase)
MASAATRCTTSSAGLGMEPGGTVLGRITIPGRPENVREARAFVAKTISDKCRCADVVLLLTSEIVTNAVLHSRSARMGGTLTLLVVEAAGGVRIQVADDGSDLSTPVVKRDPCTAGDGHGLMLVQALADEWGYVREESETTVWFWLAASTLRGG